MSKIIKAWYFEPEDGKLAYDDNRQIRKGRTHKIKGTPEPCSHGLHASKKLIDALDYAQSSKVWRVELSGAIVSGNDKLAATERTYIQKLDIEDILWEYARKCALDVVHLWDAPGVVVRYLKTGDEDLRAAARAAARDAAGAAARDAAGAAARAAARAAAGAAARAAARDAAGAAAGDAAGDAARKKQGQWLERRVKKAMKGAMK